MRIPLTFSQTPAVAAPRASPKLTSFADRLAAGRKTEPEQPTTDDSQEVALRGFISQYLQQNALMQQMMSTQAPLPDLDTE